jgi:hypothetical protein
MIAASLILFAGVAYAASDWLKGTPDEKLKSLAEIQPGLGTVMIEYANRYSTLYYAAKNGNWEVAAYEVKEMREIQRVGETTRPARGSELRAFEKSYLEPIDAAIKSKDWGKFEYAFKAGVQACNACHAGAGFPFLKYQLPKSSSSPLLLKP